MPKGKDAEKIVKHYLSKMPVSDDIDIEDVTNLLDGSSCAVLETVIKKAGMYAGFFNKTCIEMEDIVNAFLDVKYHANSKEEEITERMKYSSVHEAGHAVMVEVLFPDMVNLAGKAAIEIKYGNMDMGCSTDMYHAHWRANDIVDNMCGYGFDTHLIEESGEAVKDRKDYLTAKIMENYYKKVQKILMDNLEFLDCIASELLEKRVLLRKDIRRIKEKVQVDRSSVNLLKNI